MRAAASVTLLALTALLSGAAWAQAAPQGTTQPGSQDEQILEQKSGTDTPPPIEQADEEELSPTYSGIGLQKVAFNIDGFDTKDAVNLDLTVIGLRVPTVPWFGVELNLGFTMIPGQVSTSSSGSSGGGILCPPFCSGGSPGSSQSEDLSATTAGAFAVFRSTGKFFGMGKLGYRYINTNIDGFPTNRTGSAWGAGIGYRWNRKGSFAELGYTRYSSEVAAIGVALSYSYEHRY